MKTLMDNFQCLAVLCLMPAICFGGPSVRVDTITCTGANSSDAAEIVTLNCAGDFYSSQGIITADKKIVISASGTVTLDNLTLIAPEIDLVAGSELILGSGLVIAADSVVADIPGGSNGSTVPYIASGSLISIGGAQPTPLTNDSLLLASLPLTPSTTPITVSSDESITMTEAQKNSSGPHGGGSMTLSMLVLLLLVGVLRSKNLSNNLY